MDLGQTKALLKKHGLSPKKLYGQNFLVDSELAYREVEAANLNGSEVVLEIGPGLGALTEHILAKGCKIYAVEKDPFFVDILKQRFSEENIEIVCADILKVKLPVFDAVISNIPYVISSPLTFKLLEHGFKTGVLTYQEEFAWRIVAEPGTPDYSRLSVAAYYYTDAEILERISPNAFYPKPLVSSALVRLKPRSPPFKIVKDDFFNVVRGMFTVRKKTVKNALTIAEKVAGIEVDYKKIPPNLLGKRVYELMPEDFARISKHVR